MHVAIEETISTVITTTLGTQYTVQLLEGLCVASAVAEWVWVALIKAGALYIEVDKVAHDTTHHMQGLIQKIWWGGGGN